MTAERIMRVFAWLLNLAIAWLYVRKRRSHNRDKDRLRIVEAGLRALKEQERQERRGSWR